MKYTEFSWCPFFSPKSNSFFLPFFLKGLIKELLENSYKIKERNVGINVKFGRKNIEIKFCCIYQSNKKKSSEKKTEQQKIKHICTEKEATIQQRKKATKKMVKLFVIKLFILSIIILEGNKVQTQIQNKKNPPK